MFVYNYYRAAIGLNVASVLCANRSTLFFDVCNICYGILMQNERRKKKIRQGISTGRRPFRPEIFQRAAGAASSSTTEICREGRKKEVIKISKKDKRIERSENEKLSDRRNGVT